MSTANTVHIAGRGLVVPTLRYGINYANCVPSTRDRFAVRNPQRQDVPPVMHKAETAQK